MSTKTVTSSVTRNAVYKIRRLNILVEYLTLEAVSPNTVSCDKTPNTNGFTNIQNVNCNPTLSHFND